MTRLLSDHHRASLVTSFRLVSLASEDLRREYAAELTPRSTPLEAADEPDSEGLTARPPLTSAG